MFHFQNKKRILIGLVCGIISASSICAQTIVSTSTILHDMVIQIKPKALSASCVLPIGADPHNYEPTASDAQKIANADILIKNGLHLEGWLDKLLEEIIDKSNPTPILVAADSISALFDSNGISPDPHIWMDMQLGIQMAKNIGYGLIRNFPKYSEEITSNLNQYCKSLLEVDFQIRELVKTVPKEKRILVTTHDAFRYYGRAYGFQVASLQGISPDSEVRTVDYAHIISIIRDLGVSAIFVETTINPQLFERIAIDEGIQIGGELFADSVGDSLSEGPSYAKMVLANTQIIVNALLNSNPIQTEKERFPIVFFIIIVCVIAALLFWAIKNLQRKKLIEPLSDKFELQIQDISVNYGRKTAVSHVHLNLQAGQMVGILGPNGSGKSTLLKAALGLISKSGGSAIVEGKTLEARFAQIAYIPQREELDTDFPATVMDIVMSGKFAQYAIGTKIPKFEQEDAVKALEMVGLEHVMYKSIGNLSGGQQQRVFLARALCQHADILILDEPFVGVDAKTEETIIHILKQLSKEGKLVIIVHHDLSDISEYFDYVVLMNQRLIAAGPVATTFNDENIRKTFHSKLYLVDEQNTI